MFAILAGVDASSKTSFLTNLSKVDDKIVSFFCHKRMDGLVCFKIVFLTVIRKCQFSSDHLSSGNLDLDHNMEPSRYIL